VNRAESSNGLEVRNSTFPYRHCQLRLTAILNNKNYRAFPKVMSKRPTKKEEGKRRKIFFRLKIGQMSNPRAISIILLFFTVVLVHDVVSLRAKGSRRVLGQKGDLTTKKKGKKDKTLTLKGLKSVLLTEADDEFSSSSSNTTLDQELFQAANEYQFNEALQAENKTLAYMNSTGQDVPIPTFPFIICNEAQNISGYQRYQQISVFGPLRTEALLNSIELSCWFVLTTATNASSVVQQNQNLSLTAVGPYAKLRRGTISAIQVDGAREFLVQLCPGVSQRSGPPPPTNEPVGPANGKGPKHKDKNIDAIWEDILSSLKRKTEEKGPRKLVNQRSHVTENFYWTHLLERSQHHSNMGRNLLQNIPRATLWARALQEGIDSSHQCADMFDVLHISPLEDGNSFRLQVGGLSDAGSGSIRYQQDYNSSSLSCVLSLIAGVSSHPLVCSVVNAPFVKLFDKQAEWIVQSDGQYDERPWFDAGIRGENQVVAIADTGIDSNHCYFSDGLPFNKTGVVDFTRRKVIQYKGVDNLDSVGGHGTHTAGIIAGAKAIGYGKAEGIARNAKLVFFDISDDSNIVDPLCCKLPRDWTKLLNNSYTNGTARVQSFSWGASYNQYHIYDQWMDSFVYSHPDFVIVTAAGNNGTQYGVGSPAVAKNVITVGSTFSIGRSIPKNNNTNMHYLSTFSSRGPTADGRIKPDIVAPGEWVLSAMARPDLKSSGEEICDPDVLPKVGKSNGGLIYDRGTSMATPVVSGTVALIRQYFEEGWHSNGTKNEEVGFSPSAALVKAILINGAQQLLGIGNVDGNVKDYDFNQGFGRISLHNEVPFRNNNIALLVDNDKMIKNGEVHSNTIQTAISNKCNISTFTVSLVWTDPPAAPGKFYSYKKHSFFLLPTTIHLLCYHFSCEACSSCVLNDLDLSIVRINDGKTFYPNGLNTKDSLNNAERVRVTVRDNETFTITIQGSNLSTESQNYALVASGCFQLLPNGISNDQNAASAVKRVSGSPFTSVPIADVKPSSNAVTPLPVALDSGIPLTRKPVSTKRPLEIPRTNERPYPVKSRPSPVDGASKRSSSNSLSKPVAPLLAVSTSSPLHIKKTPLPSELQVKKPTSTHRPLIPTVASLASHPVVDKVTPSPVASTAQEPSTSSTAALFSTYSPISYKTHPDSSASVTGPKIPSLHFEVNHETLFSISKGDYSVSFTSSIEHSARSTDYIKNSVSSTTHFYSELSAFLGDSYSSTIEMYNAQTNNFLCKGIAKDIARGYSCNELPSGVPIKIVITDPTTNIIHASKIIKSD